mmetsp:Transcript_18568/g.44632  ORF Transcript_18568/g.44632 Transcript_18568/m.44632 type:complete len:210 (-) Transcript_18568:52-681(-)
MDVAALTAWEVKQDIGDDQQCAVCLCDFDDLENDPPVQFSQCGGHYFHKHCALNPGMVKGQCLRCPVCKKLYGVQTGAQPSGTMQIQHLPNACEGYPGTGTFVIDYTFPHGVQVEGMVAPGQSYSGTHRQAFLPDNEEGKQVLGLLKLAFQRGLLFAVGESITTGRRNTVVWNGVHHKTSMSGGSAAHGYPDPTYFTRVKEELAERGVE